MFISSFLLFALGIVPAWSRSIFSDTSGDSLPKEPPSLEDLWGTDWPFDGINTFAHLPHKKCLLHPEMDFDIAIIGVPFDTAVSYRPGARFGPQAIRAASQRQTPLRAYNHRAGLNPYNSWAKIVDCGDVPVSPFDNSLALRQMTLGYETVLNHSSSSGSAGAAVSAESCVPRLVSLGGDHSIVLPALRGLAKKYGSVKVLHFDSHLDTWRGEKYGGGWESKMGEFNHGSMLRMAYDEGLIVKQGNLHVGLRTRLSGEEDYAQDDEVGFERIFSDDVFDIGISGIAEKILEIIGLEDYVYLTFDIDVIDPSQAPGTGTPETGGLLTREIIQVLRKIEGLNIVGADIVEVSPAYDHSEITALAASQVAFEIITSMVKKGPLKLKEQKAEKLVHQGDFPKPNLGIFNF